jgi:hypothetical protein
MYVEDILLHLNLLFIAPVNKHSDKNYQHKKNEDPERETFYELEKK